MKYLIPFITLSAGFLAGRLLKMKQTEQDDSDNGISAIFWVVVGVAVIGVGLGTVWMIKQVRNEQ